MKYYLLQHGDGTDSHTLHAFSTPAERDAATIKCIFGDDLTTQDEAEQWDKMREELNDRGVLTFEGDPGLEWFTATLDSGIPPSSDNRSFEDWWRNKGSGIAPNSGEEVYEFAHRVCREAWRAAISSQ